MTDLEAAVKRVKRFNANPLSEYRGLIFEQVEDAFRSDLHILADAYLAEHDPTPISKEGLEGLGFADATDGTMRLTLGNVLVCADVAHGIHFRLAFKEEGRRSLWRPTWPQPPTLGAVRRLIETLKENG